MAQLLQVASALLESSPCTLAAECLDVTVPHSVGQKVDWSDPVLRCFSCCCSHVGMDWARYIVALGALMGIVTTTLVGLDICCPGWSVGLVVAGSVVWLGLSLHLQVGTVGPLQCGTIHTCTGARPPVPRTCSG